METEFSVSTGERANIVDKNINDSIKKTVANGQDFTNVVVKGSGDVIKENLDKELDRLMKKRRID